MRCRADGREVTLDGGDDTLLRGDEALEAVHVDRNGIRATAATREALWPKRHSSPGHHICGRHGVCRDLHRFGRT